MIREGKTHQLDAWLQSPGLEGTGSQSLDKCLLRYVREGLIDREEALATANDPDAMRDRLEDINSVSP